MLSVPVALPEKSTVPARLAVIESVFTPPGFPARATILSLPFAGKAAMSWDDVGPLL